MDILERVRDFISQERLLDPGVAVLVGASGGPDSTCLLHILQRLGYQLHAAHLDHQLRPESGADAEFVARQAKQLGVPVVMGQIDVGALAAQGGSIEETARLARYRFMQEQAAALDIDCIAVGHTADDQVETVLMHLLRGAGPSGLAGMRPLTALGTWVGIDPDAPQRLVRPLLLCDHAGTVRYCQEHGLATIRDPSNQDLAFTRNRVRHELLPALQRFNPNIRGILTRTAGVMRAISDFMSAELDRVWPYVIRPAGARAFRVDWQAYDSLSLALQRALLRVAAYRLKPDLRDISFDQVERGRTFLNSGQNGARASLCADLELIHLGEQVVLREVGAEVSFPELPQLHGDAALRLDPPQEVDLDSGWRLAVVFKRLDQDSRATAMRGAGDRREAAFDRERIAWPIALRPPSPGDRIQPLGMSGSLKVANLFVNEKIPWPARARWPIIADQAQVLWVSSLRMAHSARLTQGTHEALVMRLIPPEPPFQR